MMGGIFDPKGVEELLKKWDSNLPTSLKDLPVILNYHPVIAIFILVFILIASVPFILFTCFALGSFAFMIISVVLIEGTLLAFGTCILASALFFATLAAFGVSLTLGMIWFLFTNWRQLMRECQQLLHNQVKAHLTLPEKEMKAMTHH